MPREKVAVSWVRHTVPRGKRAKAATILTLGLAVVSAVTGCSRHTSGAGASASDSAGPVTLAAADPHGTTAALITRWNAGHPGEQVSLHKLPTDEDASYADLLQQLAKPNPGYDLMQLPTSDTAEFAAHGWLAPLTGSRAIDTAGLVRPAVAAATYQSELYAAPVDVDAGLFYYRSDLVAKPPATWAQLSASCVTAKRLSIGCYAGQFAKGPDLTANAIEATGPAGRQLLNSSGDSAVASSAAVKSGLQLLADSYRNGVIPKAAITYRAAQSTQAFGNGSLLFMRNWASQYPVVASSASKARFKLAMLPSTSGPTTPALGGHSIGLSAAAAHKKTAVALLTYLESPSSQAQRLGADGLGPVTTASYADASLRARFPVLPVLARSIGQARSAPVSQFYPSISTAVSDSGYAAISGAEPVSAAVGQLRRAIEAATR